MCKLNFCAFLVAVAFAAVTADHHEHHRVQVDVYYESLCPDSIKFFTKQLYPSLQGNLSHFVNLTLVPYGKSSQKFDINEYTFTCHHGPEECKGNKIQACALARIDGGRPTDGYGFNRITLGFINCLMDKVKRDNDTVSFPVHQCATINDVQNMNEIENCANHSDGAGYLANLGSITQHLNPSLKSVPTIVFNKQYKDEDNTLAQNNFVKAICQYIQHDKPAECFRNAATTAKTSFALLALVASVALSYFY